MDGLALRLVFALPRNGAWLSARQQCIAAISLTRVFPAGSTSGAQDRSASGQVWRCGRVVSRLISRRGTVRPNNSFKPTPLRGSA